MTLQNLPLLHNPCQDAPVKLYAGLSAASFKDNSVDGLALWSLLRTFDISGCGDLFLDTTTALVNILKNFGYSPRSAFRLLHKADGKFLRVCQQKGRTTIKIWGLKTVCKSLNTSLAGDLHARLVKIEDFNTFKKRRAQLYASIFKPKGVTANPMTRETITGMSGLARVQQRRYEKAAGVKVKRTPNYEVEKVQNVYQTKTMEVAGKSRNYVVPRRLGNTYHSGQVAGNKGQARRVCKALTANKASFMTDGALAVRKCFFNSLKRVLRYFKGNKGHDNTAFYLVRNKYRVIKGRLEWCFHQNEFKAPTLLGKGVVTPPDERLPNGCVRLGNQLVKWGFVHGHPICLGVSND